MRDRGENQQNVWGHAKKNGRKSFKNLDYEDEGTRVVFALRENILEY